MSDQATVWRWRDSFQHDFAARMDWTVADFAHANHNPLLDVNGHAGTAPLLIDAEVGQRIELDASNSKDPDGQKLHYSWFHYGEAGLADGNLATVTIENADTAKATVTATATCGPLWLPIRKDVPGRTGCGARYSGGDGRGHAFADIVSADRSDRSCRRKALIRRTLPKVAEFIRSNRMPTG